MIKSLNLHFLLSERQLYKKVSSITHLIFWFGGQNITHGPCYSYLQLKLISAFWTALTSSWCDRCSHLQVRGQFSRVASFFCRTVSSMSSINVISELLPTLLCWPMKSAKKDMASALSLLNHMACFSSHIMFCHTNFFMMSIWLYIPAIQKMGLCWKYSVAWFNNTERNKL